MEQVNVSRRPMIVTMMTMALACMSGLSSYRTITQTPLKQKMALRAMSAHGASPLRRGLMEEDSPPTSSYHHNGNNHTHHHQHQHLRQPSVAATQTAASSESSLETAPAPPPQQAPPNALVEQAHLPEQALPDLPYAPAAGGVIIFVHVPKTGGTTVRDNFNNKTAFPQVRFEGVYYRGQFDRVEKRIQYKINNPLDKNSKTVFVEMHGRNTQTLVELAPMIREWKATAQKNGVPFYAFSLLREPFGLSVSSFNYFRVGGDPRYGRPLNATVDNLRRTLIKDPQCLYLLKSEQAFFKRNLQYNVSREDCLWVKETLHELMDWTGDTKNLSKDTLPLLTYLMTGSFSRGLQLQSTNIGGDKMDTSKQKAMVKAKDLDDDTVSLIHRMVTLDQQLYETAIDKNILAKFQQQAGISSRVA